MRRVLPVFAVALVAGIFTGGLSYSSGDLAGQQALAPPSSCEPGQRLYGCSAPVVDQTAEFRQGQHVDTPDLMKLRGGQCPSRQDGEDQPVPHGGALSGTTYKSGQLPVSAVAELGTDMFVYPTGLVSTPSPYSDGCCLFLTGTNRTQKGVEVLRTYDNDGAKAGSRYTTGRAEWAILPVWTLLGTRVLIRAVNLYRASS